MLFLDQRSARLDQLTRVQQAAEGMSWAIWGALEERAPMRSRALTLCVGAVQGSLVRVLLARGGSLSNASFARLLDGGGQWAIGVCFRHRQCFERDRPLLSVSIALGR